MLRIAATFRARFSKFLPTPARLRRIWNICFKQYMSNQSIDRDLKKGSAELLILSLWNRATARLRNRQADRDPFPRARCDFALRLSIRCCTSSKTAA